jgi:putative tryptophan/tyrosine transport system substrate-binding protein
MRRREFMALLGAATVLPLAARAQKPAMPVIGFLNSGSPDGYAPMLGAFRQGLKETGYVEGQNVAIEYRWANGDYDLLTSLAGDLVRRQVTVIAATSTPANLVAKASTSTIPIVFTAGNDPVQMGLVASLNRPGGNVTGATQLTGEVVPKRVELAHELTPAATVLGFLVNPRNRNSDADTKAAQAAAATLGLQLSVLHASTEADLDRVFASFAEMRAGALAIDGDALFNSHTKLIAELAVRHSVPAIYESHQYVADGGLASYGGSITESYRLAGAYTGKILRGEKPADLPVVQSSKVELLINLITAKALGITVPLPLLGRADEVIE